MKFFGSIILATAITQGSAGKHDGGKKADGVAHVVSTGPKEYFCPEGYEAIGHGMGMECINHLHAEHMAFCAAGVAMDGQCAFFEPLLRSCPYGYSPINGGGKKKHGNSAGCMRIDTAPFDVSCGNGRIMENGICIGKDIVNAMMVCPITSAGKKHKHGNESNGCFDLDVVAPEYVCDVGLSLRGNLCVGMQQQPCKKDQYFLNDNLDGHKRHLGEKKNKHGYNQLVAMPPTKMGLCEVEITHPARQVCPLGSFSASENHKSKKHDNYQNLQCLVRREIPLEKVCPGADYEIDYNTGMCIRIVHDDLLKICPLGFVQCNQGHKKHKHNGGLGLGNECCRVDMAAPVANCRDGLQRIGEQCAFYNEMTWRCPPGFLEDGDMCIRTNAIHPKVRYSIDIVGKKIPDTHGHKGGKKHDGGKKH